MAKQITIDPNGAALDLVDRASGIDVVGLGWPAPTDEDVWAEGAVTEGARRAQSRPQNVERRVEVRCFGPDGRTRLRELLEKVGKLRREGGEVALTLKDDSTATWRVETARIDGPSDEQWFLHHFRDSIVVPVVFVCRPYGRGVESQAAQVTETSLPVVTASFVAPAGDVPAEARIVIEDLQGTDQGFVAWGVQSRYVSSANTAQLFYEAEELTLLGSASVTSVFGESGGSAVQGTLTPVWAAMLSFEHGTHGPLTHVGDFNVWVRARRPTTNSGEVSVALEWGVGDMTRVTRNDPIVFAADDAYEGLFMWLNLGQVHVPEDASQWDGRVIARSTVTGDTLDVDCVWLQPVGEGAGEIATTVQLVSPSTFNARDDFTHSSGNLTGKTLPVGGTWSGAGDTDDFVINTTDGTARRTAVSDADVYSGRFALAGTFLYSSVAVSVDVKRSAPVGGNGAIRYGVVARYTDPSKWVMAVVGNDLPTGPSRPHTYRIRFLKSGGGVVTTLLDQQVADLNDVGAGVWATVKLLVTEDGRWFLWNGARGTSLRLVGSGYDADLAPGAALADGLVGIYDVMTDAQALTRDFDNFTVSLELGESPAICASRSLEIAHDGVRRKDRTDTLWMPVTVEGDYATVPPAGREQRDARVTVLTSSGPRIAPGAVVDLAIDDKRLTVHTTPRYLLIP